MVKNLTIIIPDNMGQVDNIISECKKLRMNYIISPFAFKKYDYAIRETINIFKKYDEITIIDSTGLTILLIQQMNRSANCYFFNKDGSVIKKNSSKIDFVSNFKSILKNIQDEDMKAFFPGDTVIFDPCLLTEEQKKDIYLQFSEQMTGKYLGDWWGLSRVNIDNSTLLLPTNAIRLLSLRE